MTLGVSNMPSSRPAGDNARREEIVAAYVARLGREAGGYEVVAARFDRTHLVYLDAALDDIARRDRRLPRRASRSGQLRSSVVEVVLRAFLAESGAPASSAGAVPDIGLAMTDDIGSIFLGGAVQRLDPELRARMVTLDLHLPPDLQEDLDRALRRFAVTYIDPDDQPAYLGPEYTDLRSALIEALVLSWMLDRGIVARHAVPACETMARLAPLERAWRIPRWLRL